MILTRSALVSPGTNGGAFVFGPFPVGTVVRCLLCYPPTSNHTVPQGCQVYSLSSLGGDVVASPSVPPASGRPLLSPDYSLDETLLGLGKGVAIPNPAAEVPLNIVIRNDRFLVVHIGDSYTSGWTSVSLFCDAAPLEV